MMDNKDEVINHLHIIHAFANMAYEDLHEQMFKYMSDWTNDAIELIKSQEPRVLDIDEFKNFTVVWFEARNHLYIEPLLTRGKIFADVSADQFRYGIEWRCWSARPTDEQRRNVKWNE